MMREHKARMRDYIAQTEALVDAIDRLDGETDVEYLTHLKRLKAEGQFALVDGTFGSRLDSIVGLDGSETETTAEADGKDYAKDAGQ